MSMIQVKINDEETHEYASGITAGDILENVYGKRSGAVAANIDGIERDMSFKINENCKIEPILGESEQGLYILRHSCAHLLAQAVVEIFPDAKPTIGPPIEHGFYYDFHMNPIGDSELKKIEKRMNQLVRENIKINREEYENNELREMFQKNKFKIEIMDEKIGNEVGSTAYRQGDFVDLCRGPHVPSTSHLRWFKLTSTSQAYWRADRNREPLTRIYGMCYATKEGLKERQRQIEEASKRDHK